MGICYLSNFQAKFIPFFLHFLSTTTYSGSRKILNWKAIDCRLIGFRFFFFTRFNIGFVSHLGNLKNHKTSFAVVKNFKFHIFRRIMCLCMCVCVKHWTRMCGLIIVVLFWIKVYIFLVQILNTTSVVAINVLRKLALKGGL